MKISGMHTFLTCHVAAPSVSEVIGSRSLQFATYFDAFCAHIFPHLRPGMSCYSLPPPWRSVHFSYKDPLAHLYLWRERNLQPRLEYGFFKICTALRASLACPIIFACLGSFRNRLTRRKTLTVPPPFACDEQRWLDTSLQERECRYR